MPDPVDVDKAQSFGEIGVSGLKRSMGLVQEEFLRDLQGERGRKVLVEMRDNDDATGSVLFMVEMALRSVEWDAAPHEESTEDDRLELLRQCMHDMSVGWPNLIVEILSMLPFGWSYFEVVYKRRQGPDANPPSDYDDGKIGWRKFALRAQESLDKWEWDPDGSLRGMWQKTTTVPVFIPIEKALLFRTKIHKGNPEGRSIFRNAYRAWWHKKRIEDLEGIGIERDLAGLPKIGAPSEVLDPNNSKHSALRDDLKEMLVNVRQDEQAGVMLPSDVYRDAQGNPTDVPMFTFELVSSAGSKQFDTNVIISRWSTAIMSTVLADVIRLGHEKVGTQALAKEKTEWLAQALQAWLDDIADVINTHEVPRLMRLNGMDPKLAPRVVPGKIQKKDLVQLADVIEKLARAGMPLFPDPALERYVREELSWPEPEVDFDMPAEVEPAPTRTQPADEDEVVDPPPRRNGRSAETVA